MRRRGKTAGEFMAELQKDPAFRERQRKAAEKLRLREREYERLFAPLLAKLSNEGANCATLHELVERCAPLSEGVVNILLLALPEFGDARAAESVARALGAAEKPFDGRPLTECFERTSDEGLKFAVLNTIALAHPHSIDRWLASVHGTWVEETLRRLS